MNDLEQTNSGTLSRWALAGMILAAAVLVLLTRSQPVGAVMTALTEGLMAVAIFVSAGGIGYAALRKVMPASASGALRALSGVLAGLWILSTLLLVVGSTVGALRWWLWWPILAVGLALAALQSRRAIERWKPAKRLDGRALVWVLAAVVAALWIAGATQPPGHLRLADNYDVLEYHLQVPREYYDANRIAPLEHNVYSHYPLGVEMLMLLAMILRMGAYEGVYVATLIHGLFGALSAAAVFGELRRDNDAQGRFSALLLASTPLLVALSWLAMVELAQVAAMTLAALWLRHWLAQPSARAAALLGAMLGLACCAKYLSVGLIAAPVLLVMLALAMRSLRRVGHVLLASGLALALFSPWLVRNTLATGNPVFPLATTLLGRGHWNQMSEQRWLAGHGPQILPPVPTPGVYEPRTPPSRLLGLFDNFVADEQFGQILKLLAGAGVCVLIASGRSACRWHWALAAVLGLQLGVWAVFTHEMPPRFLAPACVPLAILAGLALATLSAVKTNPLRRQAPPPATPWGRAVAVAVFLAAVGTSVLVSLGQLATVTPSVKEPDGQTLVQHLNGLPPDAMAFVNYSQPAPMGLGMPLDDPTRILLVGDAKAFFFPSGSLYATTFDRNILADFAREDLSAEEMFSRLRARGVTHILVNWAEIWRLATTYGFDPELSDSLVEAWQTDSNEPTLPVVERLEQAGLWRVMEGGRYWPQVPRLAKDKQKPLVWPVFTLYAMPWSRTASWRPASTSQPASAPGG